MKAVRRAIPIDLDAKVDAVSRSKVDIRLCRATLDDAESVADVLIASRAHYLPFAPLAHPHDDVRRWVRQELLPSREVTVAEDRAVIVGVLATSQDGRHGWIDQLYLRPGWDRQGIGTLLLLQAHTRLPRPIRLWTFQQNAAGRAFYERHGYRAIEFTDGAANEERCPDVLYELV